MSTSDTTLSRPAVSVFTDAGCPFLPDDPLPPSNRSSVPAPGEARPEGASLEDEEEETRLEEARPDEMAVGVGPELRFCSAYAQLDPVVGPWPCPKHVALGAIEGEVSLVTREPGRGAVSRWELGRMEMWISRGKDCWRLGHVDSWES